MKISICFSGNATGQAPRWAQALQEALPGAKVSVWQEGDAPADYAIVWGPGQAFMDAQPRLKALFNAGAGVDALLKLNLPTTLPIIRMEDGGMAGQMADYVSYALLRFYREFDIYASQQQQCAWKPRLLQDKKDFSVGILGSGILAQGVAQAVKGMGFPVAVWGRTAKEGLGFPCYAKEDGLKALLASSRILVCLLPLTPQTQGILNGQTLSQLKPGAYVINIARGAHMVVDDVLKALESGHLAGAMMDVFPQEPLPPEHPLWRHPKVILTPHVAAVTPIENAVAQIAGKIKQLEEGKEASGLVDKTLGY